LNTKREEKEKRGARKHPDETERNKACTCVARFYPSPLDMFRRRKKGGTHTSQYCKLKTEGGLQLCIHEVRLLLWLRRLRKRRKKKRKVGSKRSMAKEGGCVIAILLLILPLPPRGSAYRNEKGVPPQVIGRMVPNTRAIIFFYPFCRWGERKKGKKERERRARELR